MEGREETPFTSGTLDELTAHWRLALFAAQDALAAARAGGVSVRFGDAELGELEHKLAAERVSTTHLLEDLAKEEHVALHQRLTTPRATTRTLGLPLDVRACLFDLDAVLATGVELQAEAWRETFNDFLARRLELTGERFGPFRPFSTRRDYYPYVHGRSRLEGVHTFLASRGIRLPDGSPDDPQEAETLFGLCHRKNDVLQGLLDRQGVHPFSGTLEYLEAAREAGVRCAAISSSSNTESMLRHAGLASLIDCVVDGRAILAGGLEMKPAPDTLITACRLLEVRVDEAASFETTQAGLEAARTAGVAAIVGVGRNGRGGAFRARAEERVVPHIAELLDRQT